ncbi:TraB/GumN family protein [Nitratireductor basaltis]|uniref:GumN n=1 Tax=Nitratireductor basaltis TaxID=472175 RepID=A0A084U735_9HYPH|nr:TraB/GumN family protein [Nitratireductor basaltis]KFB08771.1 GumN precursor [Nitratireductor basaltis]
MFRDFPEMLSDTLLRLVGILHLLAFTSFLLALLGATQVRAADDACRGRDLLHEVRANEPERFAAIEKEAAGVVNGSGLLWKVEADGVAPSWLFGTMHVTDPRVLDLPDAAKAAFSEAETIVIETTDVLDRKAMMAAMAQQPELMMFTGSEKLTDHLDDRQQAGLKSALEDRGIPLQTVIKMKPWMLVSMASLPSCEMQRQEQGALVLDALLAANAKKEGKAVAGLETMVDQFEAMASLPMEFHIEGLLSTLALGDRIDDVIETMIILYTEGETGMFWPMMDTVMPGDDESAGYATFEEVMVNKRNRSMSETASAFINDGGAFIAVGALHLPGEDGLVALLQERGYRVSPVAMR